MCLAGKRRREGEVVRVEEGEAEREESDGDEWVRGGNIGLLSKDRDRILLGISFLSLGSTQFPSTFFSLGL